MLTQEVTMTTAWRTDEVDVMDIEKFMVPEFIASTYEAIYNQLWITHNRVQNFQLMAEMGQRERDEMWGCQRNLEQALCTVHDEVRAPFGHSGSSIESLKNFKKNGYDWIVQQHQQKNLYRRDRNLLIWMASKLEPHASGLIALRSLRAKFLPLRKTVSLWTRFLTSRKTVSLWACDGAYRIRAAPLENEN